MRAEHTDDSGDRRAARRAFIRTQHPDVGGDPHRFAQGLAAFDAGTDGAETRRSAAASSPQVSAYRSRRPTRVVTHAVREARRLLAGRPRRNLL